jgi:hypothetical protein
MKRRRGQRPGNFGPATQFAAHVGDCDPAVAASGDEIGDIRNQADPGFGRGTVGGFAFKA